MTAVFRTKNLAISEQAVEILAAERPMTLRQLFYRMVSAGHMTNSPKEYKRLGSVLTRLREARQVPFTWLVDHVRATLKPSSWTGLADFGDTIRQVYRKDLWARQDTHVEVFVEKDAIAGTVQPVTREFDVALQVCRGYASLSFVGEIAEQWRDIDKPVYGYYLGDFDPSGFDIERDLKEKLRRYCGRDFYWLRLGVEADDFELHDLIELPVKDSDTATISGVQPGDVVSIIVSFTSSNPAANAGVVVTNKQPPTKSRWDLETPGEWRGVKAVPGRLSYEQARDLACQTVGKCFQITSDDISNGWGKVDKPKKVFVPLYGEIDHRDQLELLNEQVEQVKPDAPDPTRVAGQPVKVAEQPDFYSGTARGRSPAAFGQISRLCQGRWAYADATGNTPPGSQVSLGFSIDPTAQLVIFGQPVYKEFQYGGPREFYATFPNLALQTAVKVRENKTYGRLRYLRWIEFTKPAAGTENAPQDITVDLSKYGIKGVKPFKRTLPRRRENIGTTDTPPAFTEWHPHAEAVYACIGDYQFDAVKDRWTLVSAHADPDDVSAKVADFYLLGHLLEHTLEDAQTARYRGIELIPLDGAVMQLSWSVGPGGFLTTASRNQEHGASTPPYPIRRREENLAANVDRARLHAAYYANILQALDRQAARGLSAGGLNK